MRYFNGNGRLTADSADDGYEFSVEVDAIHEVDANCVEGLRRRAMGGYVDTVRIDYTDDEHGVESTDELRIHVDNTQLTDEQFMAWLDLNANRLHASIRVPVELLTMPTEH